MAEHNKTPEQDDYLDQLLSQMVHQVLADEGDKLQAENDRLLRDPEAAVPVDTSKRCIKTIRRSPYRNFLRKLAAGLLVLLRRALPFVLLALLLWWGFHRLGG